MKFLSLIALFLLSCAGERPLNLGVTAGKLLPLPDSPNCVSTQALDQEKKMPTIPFSVSTENAHAAILDAIKTFGSTEIVTEKTGYIHAEFSTFVGWVDDVEFYIDDEEKVIHFRSASRIGKSDFGTNRERMEEMTKLIKEGLK